MCHQYLFLTSVLKSFTQTNFRTPNRQIQISITFRVIARKFWFCGKIFHVKISTNAGQCTTVQTGIQNANKDGSTAECMIFANWG